MSADFLVFALLALAAIVFVTLPLFLGRGKKSGANDDSSKQSQLNQNLFDENLQQLQKQFDDGEIGEKTFAKLKQELEQQLKQDQKLKTRSGRELSTTSVRIIYASIVVVVSILAVTLYQVLGAKPDWTIYQTNIDKVHKQERGAAETELRQLNKDLENLLENRLAQRDDNLQNWFLLARTYAELEDYKSALEAYQKILDVQPLSPDVISEMAQVLYLSNGNQFTSEVKRLFDQAIQLSPQNVRTISYAALTAYQSGAFQQALGYWQQAVNLSEPNTQQYQYMLQALESTKNQLRAQGVDIEEGSQVVAAADNSPKLKVNVALGDNLKLNPEYRVFIYAKAWQGPPMPLAVHDVKVADLPLTITLDESMNPGMPMKLSQFSEWELVARVSQSGTANAQSGDWQASVGPISEEQSDQTFQLVITSQIP